MAGGKGMGISSKPRNQKTSTCPNLARNKELGYANEVFFVRLYFDECTPQKGPPLAYECRIIGIIPYYLGNARMKASLTPHVSSSHFVVSQDLKSV